MPKYDVEVRLVGTDGNAFALMGQVVRGLRKAKAPQEDIDAFMKEATAGDYNHLIATCCEWVDVV